MFLPPDFPRGRVWLHVGYGKSSGFADFENTVDRGSAVIFYTDSKLCLFYARTLGPKRNLDHRSFCSLDRYVNEFIQVISFFEIKKFI